MNSDGSAGTVIGNTTVNIDGTFNVPFTSTPTGPVRVVVSGGSYVSELDGSTQNTTLNITTLVDSVSTLPVVLPVNPLTTFVDSYAAGQAQAGLRSLTLAHQQSNKILMQGYGFPSGTLAEQVLPSFSASASGNSAQLLSVLGGLESEASSLNVSDRGTLVAALSQDISDGVFDGMASTKPVSFGNSTLPATAGASQFLSSVQSFGNVQAAAFPQLAAAVQTMNTTLPMNVVYTGRSFALPGPGTVLGGLAVGPDGNLWYTGSYFNNPTSIVKFTLTGNATVYPLGQFDNPLGITAGPDGAMWFTIFNSNNNSCRASFSAQPAS